ncbi:MAG: PqqD family protein [Candidatus Competibacteraceae bacterium]
MLVIWEAHQQGLPIAAIAERLARRFAVSSAQAEQDVRMTVDNWRQARLLDRENRGVFSDPLSPNAYSSQYLHCHPHRRMQLSSRQFDPAGPLYSDTDLFQTLQPLLQHLRLNRIYQQIRFSIWLSIRLLVYT